MAECYGAKPLSIPTEKMQVLGRRWIQTVRCLPLLLARALLWLQRRALLRSRRVYFGKRA